MCVRGLLNSNATTSNPYHSKPRFSGYRSTVEKFSKIESVPNPLRSLRSKVPKPEHPKGPQGGAKRCEKNRLVGRRHRKSVSKGSRGLVDAGATESGGGMKKVKEGRVYDSLPAINVPLGCPEVSRDGNTREARAHACLVGRRIASHKVGGYGCPEASERLVDKQLRWNPEIRGQIRIPRFGAPIGSTRGPRLLLLRATFLLSPLAFLSRSYFSTFPRNLLFFPLSRTVCSVRVVLVFSVREPAVPRAGSKHRTVLLDMSGRNVNLRGIYTFLTFDSRIGG